jgi:hypothetical protein
VKIYAFFGSQTALSGTARDEISCVVKLQKLICTAQGARKKGKIYIDFKGIRAATVTIAFL